MTVYDKKKLIILRAVLIAIGGAVGGLSLWQYFVYYPSLIGREYRIVIAVVSSAFCALILGLSAKPFYRLGASIAENATAIGSSVGARGILAVVLAFAAACAFVTAFDAIIKRVQDIWAVRLLTDILVYMVCAALCGYGFTKWLALPRAKDGAKAEQPSVGYLISAECFADERVFTAVRTLINVRVCDGAFKALCLYGGESGLNAAKRLNALMESGDVRVVKCDDAFADMEGYRAAEKNIAASKRLKQVCLNDCDQTAIALALFAAPTATASASMPLSTPPDL